MNDLLKRGEDLDKLMEKSKDVSSLSYDFYKNAKKANKRCCSLYWLLNNRHYLINQQQETKFF